MASYSRCNVSSNAQSALAASNNKYVLKDFMRYICKILVKLSQFFQNPEIRKVTLDYKLHLPSVEFGIKNHGSDEKCQIRGSGRSRTIELNACGGRTTQER